MKFFNGEAPKKTSPEAKSERKDPTLKKRLLKKMAILFMAVSVLSGSHNKAQGSEYHGKPGEAPAKVKIEKNILPTWDQLESQIQDRFKNAPEEAAWNQLQPYLVKLGEQVKKHFKNAPENEVMEKLGPYLDQLIEKIKQNYENNYKNASEKVKNDKSMEELIAFVKRIGEQVEKRYSNPPEEQIGKVLGIGSEQNPNSKSQ